MPIEKQYIVNGRKFSTNEAAEAYEDSLKQAEEFLSEARPNIKRVDAYAGLLADFDHWQEQKRLESEDDDPAGSFVKGVDNAA